MRYLERSGARMGISGMFREYIVTVRVLVLLVPIFYATNARVG